MDDLTSNLKLFLSVSLILIFTSCQPTKKALPAKTHEGKNIYGYNLNWDNKNYTNISYVFDENKLDSINKLTLLFSDVKNQLYYDYEFDLTMVFIKNNSLFTWKTATFKNQFSHSNYILDTTTINFVDIQYLDTAKRIMAADFEFNFISIDSAFNSSDSVWYYEIYDTVTVKKGRFDITY